jgi:hypothetical protein
MSTSNKHGFAFSLAALVLALAGCAAPPTTSTSQSTTVTGSGPSPYTPVVIHPFSLNSCMKYDVLPQECERVLNRGY